VTGLETTVKRLVAVLSAGVVTESDDLVVTLFKVVLRCLTFEGHGGKREGRRRGRGSCRGEKRRGVDEAGVEGEE
jgi:hypothetical protein